MATLGDYKKAQTALDAHTARQPAGSPETDEYLRLNQAVQDAYDGLNLADKLKTLLI